MVAVFGLRRIHLTEEFIIIFIFKANFSTIFKVFLVCQQYSSPVEYQYQHSPD